jgi:hypothetical protein
MVAADGHPSAATPDMLAVYCAIIPFANGDAWEILR